jgi:hypothetical protein
MTISGHKTYKGMNIIGSIIILYLHSMDGGPILGGLKNIIRDCKANAIKLFKQKMVKFEGRLHPRLEVPKLTRFSRESNPGLHGGRRALRKRSFRTA